MWYSEPDDASMTIAEYMRSKMQDTKNEVVNKLKKNGIVKHDELTQFVEDYFEEIPYAMEIADKCEIDKMERASLSEDIDYYRDIYIKENGFS